MLNLTKQEAFDKVVRHMRAQGNPWGPYREKRNWSFVNPENPCQRCAKGILMNISYSKLGNQYFVNIGEITNTTQVEYALMLNKLEYVFEFEKEKNWELKFKTIAKEENIVYTKPMEELNRVEEIING